MATFHALPSAGASHNYGDVFDLRAGDNVIDMSSGQVFLNSAGSEAAADNAAALATLTAQDLLDRRPAETGALPYEDLYENAFAADNTNLINISYRSTLDWFEVHGSYYATDVVNFQGWSGGGLNIQSLAADDLLNNHPMETGDYVVRTNDSNAAMMGWLDGFVDTLTATAYADNINLGMNAKLEQIVGGGGSDTIVVDTAGIGVFEDAGNASITVGSHAVGSFVQASSGNLVTITTQASLTSGVEEHRVEVDLWGTPTVVADAPPAPVTVVASEATAKLYADVFTGLADVTAGKGDTTIVINATADHVAVVDNGARSGELDIQFLDAEGSTFDILDLKGAQYTVTTSSSADYHVTWQTASGRSVVIDVHFDPAHTDNVLLGGPASGWTALSSLVAGLTPQPQPHP